MAKTEFLGALVGHTPRMADENTAPEFVRNFIAGARRMGEAVRKARPDVLVVQSAHWTTTFHWYVTSHQSHQGICVSTEAPDLVQGLKYQRKGDPEFAEAIAEEATAKNAPCRSNDNENFIWDYGSLVPLQYMDPEGEIPVVLLGTCMAATLDECMVMGEAIRIAAQKTGRRALFVASGALSHKLVRVPDQWPSPEFQEMDRKYAKLLTSGNLGEARAWLPEFAKTTFTEADGRHVATLLGALDGQGVEYEGEEFGYGQSSGSGNFNILLLPQGS